MITAQHDPRERRAPVASATLGLGRAIAMQLARDGAALIVHGRDTTRGTETDAAIGVAGGRAHILAADGSRAAI